MRGMSSVVAAYGYSPVDERFESAVTISFARKTCVAAIGSVYSNSTLSLPYSAADFLYITRYYHTAFIYEGYIVAKFFHASHIVGGKNNRGSPSRSLRTSYAQVRAFTGSKPLKGSSSIIREGLKNNRGNELELLSHTL